MTPFQRAIVAVYRGGFPRAEQTPAHWRCMAYQMSLPVPEGAMTISDTPEPARFRLERAVKKARRKWLRGEPLGTLRISPAEQFEEQVLTLQREVDARGVAQHLGTV